MARKFDYDGNIQRWDEFGILPDEVKTFVDVVASKAKKRSIAVVGDANGLICAGLAAKGLEVYLYVKPAPGSHQMAYVPGTEQPKVAYMTDARPRATGAYGTRRVDPASKEFADFMGPDVVLVGRKTLQGLYDAEWIERINQSGLELMISEAIEGGSQLFNSVEIESAFLARSGWTPKVTKGNIIWSVRGQNDVS